MGEGSLDEDAGHEAEGAGGAGFFGFDGEGFSGEFAAFAVAGRAGGGKPHPYTGNGLRFPPVPAEAFLERVAQTYFKPGFRVQEVSHWSLNGL